MAAGHGGPLFFGTQAGLEYFWGEGLKHPKWTVPPEELDLERPTFPGGGRGRETAMRYGRWSTQGSKPIDGSCSPRAPR